MLLESPFIKFQDELYFAFQKFQNPDEITLEKIKNEFIFDRILRKNNFIYLCNKIEEVEIISEYITSKFIITSVVEEFLNKKEFKKIEEIDNYILEINSDEKIQYDSEITKEILNSKLTESLNVIEKQ